MKNTNLKKCFTASLLGIIALGGYAQVNYVEPPIMGWSSWNTYRININEELIKKQADAMISQGLDKVGYHFINIDDGFFGFRDEKGILHTHPQRFPNGMKGIADYIHSLGLKAGIYSEAGANTCGSLWDGDKNGIGVGLYGFEHQDANLFFNFSSTNGDLILSRLTTAEPDSSSTLKNKKDIRKLSMPSAKFVHEIFL